MPDLYSLVPTLGVAQWISKNKYNNHPPTQADEQLLLERLEINQRKSHQCLKCSYMLLLE